MVMLPPTGVPAKHSHRLYSCRRGVVAVARDADLLGARSQGWLITPSSGVRLMPPASSDELLPWQIRLGFELEDEDLRCINYDSPQASAATVFGPPQDKNCNQDFCLSGTIDDGSGNKLAFAAVADGVTTGSFWPQRGAQIACFSAFSALKQLWRGGLSRASELKAEHVAELRDLLAETVAERIRADRSDLLYDYHGVPPDWDPAVFERSAHLPNRWHTSTLLVAAVAASGGLFCFAGDGGIHVVRSRPDGSVSNITTLESTDDMKIRQFVSPEFTGADLSCGVIATEGYDNVEIIVCTDGVDRTLSRAGMRPWDFVRGQCSNVALTNLLETLPSRYGAQADVDNYALARIAWPELETRSLVVPPATVATAIPAPQADVPRNLAQPWLDIGGGPGTP